MAVVLPEVNEGTPITCTVCLYGDDDDLVLPSTLEYQVIDKYSKTVTQEGELGDAEVVEDGLEKSVAITISGANNAILDQSKPYERRIVLVTVNSGEVIGKGEYVVQNVRSIGTTP